MAATRASVTRPCKHCPAVCTQGSLGRSLPHSAARSGYGHTPGQQRATHTHTTPSLTSTDMDHIHGLIHALIQICSLTQALTHTCSRKPWPHTHTPAHSHALTQVPCTQHS